MYAYILESMSSMFREYDMISLSADFTLIQKLLNP